MSDFILAMDQGTSSSRSLLFDRNGKLICKEQIPLSVSTPEGGWVEQDPKILWENQLKTAQRVLEKISKDDCVGLSITNQRETTIAWDRITGQALAPAIVWQDRRTTDFCEQIKHHEETIQAAPRASVGLSPAFHPRSREVAVPAATHRGIREFDVVHSSSID